MNLVPQQGPPSVTVADVESAEHLILFCPALARTRLSSFGPFVTPSRIPFKSLQEFLHCSVADLLDYQEEVPGAVGDAPGLLSDDD